MRTIFTGYSSQEDSTSSSSSSDVDALRELAFEDGLQAAKTAADRGAELTEQVQEAAVAAVQTVTSAGFGRDLGISIATEVANRVVTAAGAVMVPTARSAANPERTDGSPSPPASSPRRTLSASFRCNKCDATTTRLINRLAYEKGTVYAQCSNAECAVWHLFKDNLDTMEEIVFSEGASWSGESKN